MPNINKNESNQLKKFRELISVKSGLFGKLFNIKNMRVSQVLPSDDIRSWDFYLKNGSKILNFQSTSVSYTKNISFQNQFKIDKNKLIKKIATNTNTYNFSGIQDFLHIFENNLRNVKRKKEKPIYYVLNKPGYLIIFTDYMELSIEQLNNTNIDRYMNFFFKEIELIFERLFTNNSCFINVILVIQINIRKLIINKSYNINSGSYDIDSGHTTMRKKNCIISSGHYCNFDIKGIDYNQFDNEMRIFVPGLKSLK